MANILSSRRILFFLILLAAAFFAKDFLPSKNPLLPPEATAPVSVATAISQDVPHYLQGIGTVTALADVLVTSRVSGTLMRVHFEEGQRVEAGQLLAEIDPRPFEAALAQAKGNLARDEAQLSHARIDLNRYSRLAAKDYVAKQTYDENLAEVRQLEGTVAADKAAVRTAELDLIYSRITAPVSGRLGLRNVDPGTLITANDTTGIVRITEVKPCYVVFPLPETHISLILEAMNATSNALVEIWNRDQTQKLACGELVSVDNRIDPSTGTIKLKALVANENERLFANEFVNARLRVRIITDAVTVPPSAVQLGSSGNYLFVVDENNTVHLRQVETGIATNAVTIINKGLSAGEKVVVDGVDRLRQGTKVRIAGVVETVNLASKDTPLTQENSPRILQPKEGAQQKAAAQDQAPSAMPR